MEFDKDTAQFKSSFIYDRKAAMALTEIFVNKNLWYSDSGYAIKIYEDSHKYREVEYNLIKLQNDNLVLIELKNSYRLHGKTVTIEIVPYVEP